MATATAAEVENPNHNSDPNSTLPATEDASSAQPPASSGGGGGETKDKSAAARTSDDGGGATDIQKKMKRAERFGMPVQLSEEEKRNSRAQRFGTGSAVKGLDSSKSSEELKRKARAERPVCFYLFFNECFFGVSFNSFWLFNRFGITQSDPSDEEAKKKARLARFGSLSKIDSAEEDKKEARAIRFSQLDSGPKANGKGNIDVKTAIAGKPCGGT